MENIPVPITFNPYKHHFGFLSHKIAEWKHLDWSFVKSKISYMGNNLLDLYLGSLPVSAICHESLLFFEQLDITTREQFFNWLDSHEYEKIVLSDQSVWIVKKGIDPERYIHIHPAKNSVHSIRVRATTLKTVTAAQVLSEAGKTISLDEINSIRTDFLDLSPVKSIHPEKGILKLWKLFNLP